MTKGVVCSIRYGRTVVNGIETMPLRAAARAFLSALDDAGRAAAVSEFGTPDRKVWTYLPGPRPGVASATSRMRPAVRSASCSMSP
jgi:hypothetical protein